MKITYENKGDYYVFSDNPDTRVYLGNASPEDYIHDVEQQTQRSESCYYYDIKTGKKVSQDEAFDKSFEKGELIWHGAQHELDKIENYTYGYKCEYDFKRKLALASYGGPRKSCKYISKDKAMNRLATAYFFDQTLEEYDKRQEEFQKERDESKRKNPSIHNLMCVSGETYYVDDDGNRITPSEHIKLMKEQLGEDCFDIEAKR